MLNNHLKLGIFKGSLKSSTFVYALIYMALQLNVILYSRIVSRAINFAIFMESTAASKILIVYNYAMVV